MIMTMTLTIQSLAKVLHSLNPRLLQIPPPKEELTGHDICYLGPNGEDDLDKVIFCRDLQEGLRPLVGSWYISPERHIVESIITTVIALLILRYFQQRSVDGNTITKQPQRQPPPKSMKLIALLLFTIQVTYKLIGYSGKILNMLAPCNLLWILAMFLFYYPKQQQQQQQMIVQLFSTYVMSPVIALAVPDLDDLVYFGEVPMFFLHHMFLIFIPVFYIATGRVSLLFDAADTNSNNTTTSKSGARNNLRILLSSNIRHWLIGSAYFSILYFPIVSLISIVGGMNLNYMLSPPPNPGDMVSGENFRLMSIGCCLGIFLLGRVLMVLLELLTAGWRLDHDMKGRGVGGVANDEMKAKLY